MAKKVTPIKYDMKKINKLSSDIQDGIDSLYTSTYFNTPDNNKDLESIKTSIDASINKITASNYNATGNTSITNLYTRLKGTNPSDSELLKSFEELFGDEQRMSGLLSTYTNQKYVRDMDQEIDSVCKYMPKLQEALDTKKDNVLTSDTFGKDFLNARNASKTGDQNVALFNERFVELKEKYNLTEFLEKSYDNASKYGEDFIYISPYKKEFATILNNRAKYGNISSRTDNSAITISTNESGIISFKNDDTSIMIESSIQEIAKKNNLNLNINIQLENGGISSVHYEASIVNKYRGRDKYSPSKFDKSLSDDMTFDDFKDYDKTSTDGFIDNKTITEKAIKVNGCVVKRLKRDRVIPIYIENTCLGYYYFEIPDITDDFGAQDLRDPLMALKKYTYTPTSDPTESTESEIDAVIKYLAAQLSEVIDAKFIEANQDIKKEIYMILKYNDIFNSRQASNIKVSYIPPEYIHHIYFDMDETTHRGISDLANALLPAKLYSALYITNSIGVLTRGQDKRVYYVKQTVDTNISQSLINAINQIKKSNFGLREINSIGQVLNITGRYNDYFIPTSQGDPPIQFEIMQGQNIDIKSDLMNILEEMAVNAVDVPLELIQSRQSADYATQYVMSNSKFLRSCFKRQSISNKKFSRMVTCIYNYEYDENDKIEVTLPPPLYLRLNNMANIIDNTKQYVEGIANYEYPDQNDEKAKMVFIQKMMRYQLQSHVDQTIVEKLKSEAETQVANLGSNNEE